MEWLLVLVTLTVFTLMLCIGINQSLVQLFSVWRRLDVLPRALLAAIILVPAVVLLLEAAFDLSPEVAAGLVLLAASPGAPMTTKRAHMAAADTDYVSSLQLALALLAVVVIRTFTPALPSMAIKESMLKRSIFPRTRSLMRG